MNKKNITTLITDLDNTLWDWVNIWHSSFSAMLSKLERLSGLSREILLTDIKSVFQRRRTSEYSFVIEEIESLIELHPGENLESIYREAITAYRDARSATLQLYPSVLDTLRRIKQSGCQIIGYTESMQFYTCYRVRKLGLDGLLDAVYSPADHDLPEGMTRNQIRTKPEDEYQLKLTHTSFTPEHELKPNKKILLSIINERKCLIDETAYVGDSLMKDIAMAQDAGIVDVLAKYGCNRNSEAYELLRKVTHWSDEDVAREKEIMNGKSVTPTFILEDRFSEIFNIFNFNQLK